MKDENKIVKVRVWMKGRKSVGLLSMPLNMQYFCVDYVNIVIILVKYWCWWNLTNSIEWYNVMLENMCYHYSRMQAPKNGNVNHSTLHVISCNKIQWFSEFKYVGFFFFFLPFAM